MASNRHEERLERAREEELRLEAELYGKAEQEKTVLDNGDVVAPEESIDLMKDSTDEFIEKVTIPEDTLMKPTDDALAKQLADAEHRFNRYKGSTDRTLFELRKENADLLRTVSSLRTEIASKSTAIAEPTKDVFTQEAYDILGEDAINAIKASNASVQAQLDEVRLQLKKKDEDNESNRAAELLAQNEKEFMTNLEKLVPDLQAMNADDDFNEWLRSEGPDGVERLTVLRDDQARFDYRRVSEFFIEYKRKKTTGPRKVTDDINQHIGPTNSNTGQSNRTQDPRSKGTIKQSEINAFQRKVAKGDFKYFPEKAEAFEARVFKAMNEDKIIFDTKPNI